MSLGPLFGGISSSSVGIGTEWASSYSVAKNANPAVAKEKTLQMCSKGKRLSSALSRLHPLNHTRIWVYPVC
eukprot:6500712-Ditylum_brightwellii.AAC.1